MIEHLDKSNVWKQNAAIVDCGKLYVLSRPCETK